MIDGIKVRREKIFLGKSLGECRWEGGGGEGLGERRWSWDGLWAPGDDGGRRRRGSGGLLLAEGVGGEAGGWGAAVDLTGDQADFRNMYRS